MESTTIIDPEMSAKEAGLQYVDPSRPGITRHRAGKGFFYRNPNGDRIADRKVLDRISKVVIPPAWTEVWICPSPNGHVQAVGRDAKGRRQHRYHPRWREVRDETKYERMLSFGRHLPAIRERVDADLRRHGLPKEKVVAAVVHLLEATLIRVGNEEYAKTNKSFGLTTMLDRHVDVGGSKLEFNFKGKSGVAHQVEFRNRQMANIVKRCQDLPGQDLFQYLDQEDEPQTVSSDDINRYLREITGEEFTAKDFRTWAGTVLAAEALASFEEVDSDSGAKKNIVAAIESVAARLGNTKTICRKCYVHPAVIDAYLEGDTVETVMKRAKKEIARSLSDLPPEEAAVLTLLHHRLDQVR